MCRTIQEIKAILNESLPSIRQEFGVATIELFGSYVRGEQTEESDIDILITFDKPIGLIRFVALEYHLSDLLGIRVDLVMRSALKPAIGKQILSEAIAI